MDDSELDEKVNKLIPILKKYKIKDLIIGAFCINSWRDNRSLLYSSMALNKCICDINYNTSGELNINNYSEFKSFFYEIYDILKKDIFDDYILNDFGEVKIKFREKLYPVIIGTGYENSYITYKLLEELVHLSHCDDILLEILEYLNSMINSLNVNISLNNNYIDYNLPSEEYFYQCKNYIENILPTIKLDEMKKIFLKKNISTFKKHFIVIDEFTYPLFNTSILIDFYNYLIEKSDKVIIRNHFDILITKSLYENFNDDDKTKIRFLLKVSIAENGSPISKEPYEFALIGNKKIIIAINTENYKSNELNDEISKIEKYLKEDKLILGEVQLRNDYNHHIMTKIPNSYELEIINIISQYNPDTIAFIPTSNEILTMMPSDIVFFLNFIDKINDLFDFIDFYKNTNSSIITFGGISSLFINWIKSNKLIQKGAIKIDLLNIDYGTIDNFIYEYFSTILINYPLYDNSNLLSNPFKWILKPIDDGFLQFQNKNNYIIGIGKFISNENYVISYLDLRTYTSEEYISNLQNFKIIDEINLKTLKFYAEKLNFIEKYSTLTLRLVSLDYLKNKYNYTINNNKLYVYSILKKNKDLLEIDYAVNTDKLSTDIINSENKKIEIVYLIELLFPISRLYEKEFKQLKSELELDKKLKKEMDIIKIEMDYYFEYDGNFYIDDMFFEQARKTVAEIACKIGIKPSLYKSEEALALLESLVNNLNIELENELLKYNKRKLNIKLLNILAKHEYAIIINKNRYYNFKNLSIDESAKIKSEALKYREEYKEYIRDTQFLLETNLTLIRNTEIIPDENAIKYLCAYAHWIVNIQDALILCKLNDPNIEITIDSDFLVYISDSKYNEKYKSTLLERYYNAKEFFNKCDNTDSDFLDNVIYNFEKEVNIKFKDFLELAEFLKMTFTNYKDYRNLDKNVYEFDLLNLKTNFEDCNKKYNLNISTQIEDLINFFTIDIEKIKYIKDTKYDIVPIWNREQRCERIDIKPLIKEGEKIYFSPILVNTALEKWKSGFLDFYPPYEINLDNTLKSIETWKNRYEQLIVDDIVKLFNNISKKSQLLIFKDAMLNEIDKRGCHPKILGDYDVLVIDTTNKLIWNIECKFIRKTGTIFESIMQQKGFFYDHKFDEKFQRRIDYISNPINYNKVLKSLNIPCCEYECISLMVTNKLFSSTYKEIKFDIMTYGELELYINTIYDAKIVENN